VFNYTEYACTVRSNAFIWDWVGFCCLMRVLFLLI